jgi:hypothetical protein
MTLFPFVSGSVNVSTTTEELYRHLTKVCEKDLPLVNIIEERSRTDFGLEWYDNSFMIWAVPYGSLSRFIFTTLHCKIDRTPDGLTLRYHIRFNLWANFLTVLALIGFLYLPFTALFHSESVDMKALIAGLASYPFFMWLFNDSASDGLKFIEELKKTFCQHQPSK